MNPHAVGTELKALFSQELHAFLNEVNGVNLVMLCSSDGFELSYASKKNRENTGKIAAVSSSILAMVSEIECQTITLDAENGKAFLTTVNHQHQPMVMVSVTNKDILMGQMLYYFKKLSDRLATAHIEKAS